jgi:hypothetical protein
MGKGGAMIVLIILGWIFASIGVSLVAGSAIHFGTK